MKKIIKKKETQIIEVEKPVVKKPKVIMEDYGELVRQFRHVKNQIKMLTDREKKLKAQIDIILEKQQRDNRGNYYFETVGEDENPLIVAKIARKSYSIDFERAKLFCINHDLRELIITETSEKFDEEGLARKVEAGEVTPEEVKEFTNEKITYATQFIEAKEETAE